LNTRVYKFLICIR